MAFALLKLGVEVTLESSEIGGHHILMLFQFLIHKTVTENIRLARKHLVEKGEIYPVSASSLEREIWKATPKGLDRAFVEGERWLPELKEYLALILARKALDEKAEADDDE